MSDLSAEDYATQAKAVLDAVLGMLRGQHSGGQSDDPASSRVGAAGCREQTRLLALIYSTLAGALGRSNITVAGAVEQLIAERDELRLTVDSLRSAVGSFAPRVSFDDFAAAYNRLGIATIDTDCIGAQVIRCPAHHDGVPLMSLMPVDGGGVVFQCHVECTREQVIEAVTRGKS